MDNVLLVGDFRDCTNFGAIGTTEELLKMISPCVDACHFKTIGHRSFIRETPPQGWPENAEEYLLRRKQEILHPALKQQILCSLDGSRILAAYRNVKNVWRRSKKLNDGYQIEHYHVPYRYGDFEHYGMRVQNGETLQYEKRLIDWADIVLINAEGSLINATDKHGYYHVSGLYPLFMAYLAKVVFRKRCYIINHTVDPQNQDVLFMIKQIYPLLDGVYIREPLSGRVLDQIQVHNYEYIPDALFAFQPDAVWSPPDELANRIDFSKPYICLGDSSGFYTDRTYPIEDLYKRLILKLRAICPQIIFIVGFGEYFPPITKAVRKLNVPFVSVLNSNYVDLYHLLKEAKIFISGRWHTSILSLLAETPILLFGSDSHKTEALYEMIEYPYPLFDVQTLPQHVDDIINATKQICSVDNHRHFQIVKTLSVKALDNAKMLSADGKYSS